MTYTLTNSILDTLRPTNLFKTIKEKLYTSVDLYENFDYVKYKNTLAPGSCPSNPLLQQIVERENPSIIVEVGSLLGYSACGMAEVLSNHKKDAVIICVDTWMGGYETWNNNELLNRKNGYPTLYYNFLANVCQANLQNYIIPLAFPSSIASRVLNEIFESLHLKADMIYIDGSHITEDVYLDCCNYYPLVKPNGLLFGDDLQSNDVKEGLKMFATKHKIENIEAFSDQIHWQLRKV